MGVLNSGPLYNHCRDGGGDDDVDAPLLRWALGRLPITEEEAERLKREEFEATGFVPQIEWMLVAVDVSPSGQLALRLVGLLAGARQMATTVIHFDYASLEEPHKGERQAPRTRAVINENIAEGDCQTARNRDPGSACKRDPFLALVQACPGSA